MLGLGLHKRIAKTFFVVCSQLLATPFVNSCHAHLAPFHFSTVFNSQNYFIIFVRAAVCSIRIFSSCKWQNLPSQQSLFSNMKNLQCFFHNRKRGFSIIPDVWIIFFQVCLSNVHSNSFEISFVSAYFIVFAQTNSGTLPEKAEPQK